MTKKTRQQRVVSSWRAGGAKEALSWLLGWRAEVLIEHVGLSGVVSESATGRYSAQLYLA